MKRINVKVLLAAAAATVAVLLLILLITGRGSQKAAPVTAPAGAGEGVAARSPAPLNGADSPVAATGCFTASRVQLAGRQADASQQYVLTLTLASAPDGEAALAQLLGTPDCSSAQQRAVDAADTALKLKPGDSHLTIAYLTPAGSRILLPGG